MTTNTMFLTIMGSHAYGVADTSVHDSMPDYDIYGWSIPPKSILFPHINGHIRGFGPEPPNFEQYQIHHVLDQEALNGKGKEYDLQIFSIVKYFELCRQGNPNMIDSLFTPENCVIHCTQVGRLVRDNRKMFVSKEVWAKFRGYCMSQMKKMDNKEPIGKRKKIVEKHGYDTKYGYHLIRLLDEVQQLMENGEMNLQRAKESMKSVRRGEWSLEDLKKWVHEKEKELDIAYTNCNLPAKANTDKLKQLLINCLEIHYGSLSQCINETGWAEKSLRDIDSLLNNVRSKLYS